MIKECNRRTLDALGEGVQRRDRDTNNLDRRGTRSQIKIVLPNAPAEMESLLNFHTAGIDPTSPLGQVIGTSAGVLPLTAPRYIEPKIMGVRELEVRRF